MIFLQRFQAGFKRLTSMILRFSSRAFGAAGGSFSAAVEYLTACPAWWGEDYGRDEIEGSPALFPVVGLIVGLLVLVVGLV